MIIFETKRLLLRPLADSDFPEVYRLISDPETMRYIRTAFTEEQPARDRVAMWNEYGQKCPGLGVFVADLKETGAFAGYCVARHVYFDPTSTEFEIGYTFAPEYWGQGLASELVPPLCQYCFEQTGTSSIVAFTDPANAASQRVLIKCGFQLTGTRAVYEGISNEYWLEKNTH